MKRLAIVTTHPIQYYAPLFRLLAQSRSLELKVFYTWEQGSEVYDKGFGQRIAWDIPLLEGYDYTFVSNNGDQRRSFRAVRNPTLVKEIEAWQADAVLVFGWNYWSHLRVMRYFKGKIPVLFRGDSHLLNDQPGFKKIVRYCFLRWVYRYIDYALYVGENNKAYYEMMGLKSQQLVYAPHAIDNDRFKDDVQGNYEKQAAVWRQELNIKDTDTVFLFVGKLESTKNPHILLEAFKKLGNHSNHLIFVGSGILANMLEKEARDDDRIHFIPFQNQSIMPLVYRLGDILVLPSEGETWGLVVNEAMASGRSVIVSDKVGCGLNLATNNFSSMFKSRDSMQLSQLLHQYGTMTRQEVLLLGQQAQQHIHSYSYTSISRAVEQVLISI